MTLKKYWPTILVFFIFVAILLINYWDVLKYNYYIPPGNDPVVHIEFTNHILETGKPLSGRLPGFYYLMAGIVKLFHSDTTTTMVYFYPFLMFLSVLAAFLFSYRFFGLFASIVTLILLGFVSGQSRQTLWDGGYASVMTSDCILVFGFLFYIIAYKSQKLKHAVLAGIILAFVLLSHRLASYLMISVGFIASISLLILSYFKKDELKKKMTILAIISSIIIAVGGWIGYMYAGKAILDVISLIPKVYAMDLGRLKSFFESQAALASAPPMSDYSIIMSPQVLYMGILALPFILLKIIKYKKEEYLFLLVWMTVVFIISRPFSFSPAPGRFGRELAIPFSIASGVFAKEVLLFFKYFWARITIGTLMFVILAIGVLNIKNWVGKYNQMVFIRDQDKQALDWVKSNTIPSANILVAPFNNWFGLLTDRKFTAIGSNIGQAKPGDYIYVNRWYDGWMWGDRAQYTKIREEIKNRDDIELVKSFGENNEQGITVYYVKKPKK